MPPRLLRQLGMMAALAVAATVTVVSPAAGLAVAGGGLACALALRRGLAKVAFLALVALVPLDSLGQLSMETAVPLTVTKLLFPPLFAAVMAERILLRRPIVAGRAGLWTLCLIGAAVLSALATGMPRGTSDGLRHAASMGLLFLTAANVIEDESDVRALLWVIVGSCMLSAYAGLIGRYAGVSIAGIQGGGPHGMRLTGASSENPNTFAGNLLVAFFVVLTFGFTSRRARSRIGLLVASGLLLVSLAYTGSRGMTVALVCGAAHMAWRLGARKTWKQAGLATVVLLLGVAAFVPAEYYERMRSLFTAAGTDPTVHRRLSYNLIGLKLFLRSPLWGIGPGAFLYHYLDQDFRLLTDQTTGYRMLHNTYMLVACETGLLGLAAFGGALGASFRNLRAAQGEGFLGDAAAALESALVAFLVSSLFLPNINQKYLWIMLGLSAAMAGMRSGAPAGARAGTAP